MKKEKIDRINHLARKSKQEGLTEAAKEEKAKFVRESVVKYFFDMSKSTFTVMVLGGMAALFGIVETDQVDSYWAIFGVCF